MKEMDMTGVLDLRCLRKDPSTPVMPPMPPGPVISSALDLRKTRAHMEKTNTSLPCLVDKEDREEDQHRHQLQLQKLVQIGHSHKLYIKAENVDLMTSSSHSLAEVSFKARWSHRSHPSMDSDSSFESEQENEQYLYPNLMASSAIIPHNRSDYACTASLECLNRKFEVDTTETTESRCSSHGSGDHRATSLGFYKEIHVSESAVAVAGREEHSMDKKPLADSKADQLCDKYSMLEFTTVKAEVIYPEDVQSETVTVKTENDYHKNSDADDDEPDDDNTLQVNETDPFIEELFKMQLKTPSTTCTKRMASAEIQEKAENYLTEIRKTKKDLFTGGQNLEVRGEGKQYCIKCRDEFHSNAALLQHLMTHSSRNPGEKLIKCPVCTKRFSTVNTLERHMLNLHTGEMKYICEICSTPFKFKTHLQRHIITSRCGKSEVQKKKEVSNATSPLQTYLPNHISKCSKVGRPRKMDLQKIDV